MPLSLAPSQHPTVRLSPKKRAALEASTRRASDKNLAEVLASFERLECEWKEAGGRASSFPFRLELAAGRQESARRREGGNA